MYYVILEWLEYFWLGRGEAYARTAAWNSVTNMGKAEIMTYNDDKGIVRLCHMKTSSDWMHNYIAKACNSPVTYAVARLCSCYIGIVGAIAVCAQAKAVAEIILLE